MTSGGIRVRKIGFDIDGVFANFDWAAANLLADIAGERKTPDGFGLTVEPPVWDWPEHYGYDPVVVAEMWHQIRRGGLFWYQMPAITSAVETLSAYWSALEQRDVYFITHRSGAWAKRQTELWLGKHLGVWPTVILTGEKGLAARALGLDAYIDDKWENALDVHTTSPATRMYVLDRPYNRTKLGVMLPGAVVRVSHVRDMLRMEVGRPL